MFVEASALVAMMTDETHARSLAERMQAASGRMTSPMEVAEASLGVGMELGMSTSDAANAVSTLLQLANIQVLAVAPRAGALAAEAFDRYGQGRHGANLDLRQCMSYACARYYRQPLLFHAGGFALTDIEQA